MKRIIAIYLVLNLVFEIISPSLALALTNGPGQPEMQSFEPVGTTEMVDIFSGDFNYNIPLLNVPGPNGGYPINLAYHSGVGMEDEASWVGLGWNINAGAITRDMRGLPDDFNGDVVAKEMTMKPNRTISTGVGFPLGQTEIWGLKLDMNMNLRMNWNNYQGIGISGGINLNPLTAGNDNTGSQEINKNNGFSSSSTLGLNFNSQTGETNLTANMSLSSTARKSEERFTLGASLSNLQGLKDINLSAGRYKIVKHEGPCTSMTDLYTKRSSGSSGGTSFASSSFIPHSSFPQSGFMIGTWFNYGGDIAGIYPNLNFNADYAQTGIATKHLDMRGYGYMHSEDRRINENIEGSDYALMDFNREKDAALSKDIPSMPVPVFTHDVYMVKGQGIGGVFRPFRSDVGVLHDPVIKGENNGGTLGAEIGPGVPMHIGGNLTLSLSRSYTGPWRKYDTWSDLAGKQFTRGGKSPDDSLVKDPLYEPFYFRAPSELTANIKDENDRVSMGTRFPVSMVIDPPGISSFTDLDPDHLLQPFVEARVNNGGLISKATYENRRSRSQLMSYKTISQVNAIPNYKGSWVAGNVYTQGTYPRTAAAAGYNFPTGIGHHLGEISVTNPDGNRYIYALPAFNTKNKEASFSIEKNSGPRQTFYNDKIINYAPNDASLNNDQQNDHFYTSNQVPTYAHSYMLTAIVSPDYVDLTGNGPSDDDFGYYVKFNYSKTNAAYHWRAPYAGANFLRGHLSDDGDDKAGYVYGEKEIWYLNSVETKTHMAEFVLSPRKDGFGAGSEHQQVNGIQYLGSEQLYKLDKINLYAKNDPGYAGGTPTPLKTVNFEYSYALCPEVPNNNKDVVMQNGTDVNAAHGKLTLKKVWFTYRNVLKGSLSPYVFDYHETAPLENPAYDVLQMDRWGNYRKDDPTTGDDNTVNPYTVQKLDLNGDGVINAQDDAIRNAGAAAWSLKRIVMPSGGELKIDYEPDDYAYVQDKQAMQMTKVLGYAKTKVNNTVISNELWEDNEYLFFELEDETQLTDDYVRRYAAGLSEMYFKVYLDLKNADGGMKTDYVEGYAEVDASDCGFASVKLNNVTRNCGYIKVKKVGVRDNGSGQQTHPFRKAGWQYLKLERPEVLYPGSQIGNGSGAGMLVQAANIFMDMINSGAQLITGFYNFCYNNNYAKVMNTTRPSFVRLTSPDKIKFGGGHRVKRLAVTDLWAQTGNEAQSEYGQEYTYRLPDGSSSGVASYEPLIGGEEIPHRKPIRYSSPYFIFKNKNLYIEEPIGESYFPAPQVGYSRVVTKALAPPAGITSTKTQDGVTVQEFYTARDFPVILSNTGPDHQKFNPKIPIPCIGSVCFENHGFSQRISVENNDMHGKPKAISTYAANANINNPNTLAATRVEYIYKTDAPYTPAGSNHLNNRVNVLYGDAIVQEADMGVSSDFFTDMRESSGVTMKQGFQANVEYTYPALVVFSGMAAVDYSESLFKSVVAMDVISRNGILMEMNSYTDGSKVSTKNLLFDANTGTPLQTTVTNDFDKPVYTYNYAANWSYPGMDNAFRNAGAVFDFDIVGGQLKCNYTNRTANDIFFPGDEVLVDNSTSQNNLPTGKPEVFWVKSIVNPTTVELVDEQGNAPAAGYAGKKKVLQGTILRSGRRNQQSVTNGTVVSLNDVLFQSLWGAWNNKIALVSQGQLAPAPAGATGWPAGTLNSYITFTYTDCHGQAKDATGFSTTSSQDTRLIFFNGQYPNIADWGCYLEIVFQPATFPNMQVNDVFNYFIYSKTSGYAVRKVGQLNQVSVPVADRKCFDVDDCNAILHASATELSDSWSFDYVDVGNPLIKLGNAAPQPIASINTSLNPYRNGTKGIWRVLKNHVYQVNRTQTFPAGQSEFLTNIATDGTYEQFQFFDWLQPANNLGWTMASQVTAYSPYGFELETKNAIGLYSAALYGYNNSLPVGVGANASYYELAYDGFEEQKTPYAAKGHLVLSSGAAITATTDDAHTGNKSLYLGSGQSLNISTTASSPFRIVLPASNKKKYVVSAWFKTGSGKPQISVSGNITAAATSVIADGVRIEGWQKVETTFEATGSTVTISMSIAGADGYIDDVRIQPFGSTLKTYVYDPQTLWLKAELDAQNYATYYNYDQEGTLVQVKKETVNGIQTLRTSRSNLKQ